MGENPQVTEQQKEWAALAMQEFDRKQFTSCCNIMNKLMSQRASDPRVVHNKAVADFCLSGSQSTDEFRQSLANVCQMVSLESLHISLQKKFSNNFFRGGTKVSPSINKPKFNQVNI